MKIYETDSNIVDQGNPVRPSKCTKLLAILILITVALVGPSLLLPAEKHPQEYQLLWKQTLTTAAKGTRIATPRSILAEVKASPDDCLDPSPEETTKVDAYRLPKRNLTLIAVWGRGSCFCSPTGNCSFWLYQFRGGKNKLLLQTDMVNEFGFLPSHTKGLPDLVIWSHDSADRFPGALWKFNGAEYVFECRWEVVSTFRDVPNGTAELAESHIGNNTCKLKLVPGTETRPNTSSKAE